MPAEAYEKHKKWFVDRFAGRGISQNSMAEYLGLEKGGLSRRLSGDAKFTTSEIMTIAGFLHEDPGEVTRHAAMIWNSKNPRR